MKPGKSIGKGRTAEAFEWEDGRIIKLFYEWVPQEWVKYEFDLGVLLNENGISSPKVFETVKVDGKSGIVYQKFEGISMLKLIWMRPWNIRKYARLMAGLQYEFHSLSEKKLYSQNERFSHAIMDSSEILGDKTGIILDYLTGLKGNCSICHGDFHPDNILVSEEKMSVIDWMNAYFGNPLGDVARTCLMIRSPYLPDNFPFYIRFFIRILKSLMLKSYIKEYIRLSGIKSEMIEEFILPVAAARLREQIPGEKEWLLEIIEEKIKLFSN